MSMKVAQNRSAMNSRLIPVIPDIVIDEAGSANPLEWTGTAHSLGNDLDAIRFHADRNVIGLDERSGTVVIKGKHRTGIILLPSGRRIVLRTKLAGIVLLDWLVYLGEFPDFKHWSQLGNIAVEDDWQNVLLKMFLHELDFVTRLHLQKDFVKQHIESSQVKGRVLAGSLARKIWRLPKMPQIVRGRNFDTPANRMLSLALGQVLLLQQGLDDNARKLLFRLRNDWSEIKVDDIDRQQVASDGMTAAPAGYGNALQLARLVLFGASMDSKSGWGGHSFTLSLAGVWERSVRQMFKELTPQMGWRSLPSSKRVRPWDDAICENDPNRLMIADILLQRDDERWVLDTKYKRDFGKESRTDRFQMCAYAIGFHANRATLVYPDRGSHVGSHRELLREKTGNTNVLIDSIALSMANGPSECRRELLSVIVEAKDELPQASTI
jgi:5-methylcytosine-specific restriction endonuclease McrBC regulatory subunit McrC